MKITNKKGFSLLEITLVLGVGAAMAFMKFQDMKSDQENIMANTVGSQMKQMGEAVNRYISIRYDKLSTLTSSSSQSSDPGPRTCSANGCEITYQTLLNEGLLPVSYTGINAQKSAYKILLKRSGTTPNYVINGLVITTLPWSEGNRVRYDLLGRAMQAAGIDSGMTQSATVASGTAGQWTESQSNYSGINAAGLLAYRVGYDSSMYSVYLRRDGTLPMTGDLNMGGQSINYAKDITASGDVNATSFNGTYGRFAKNVGISEDLTVNGFSTFGKNVSMNSQLTVKNGINSESYVSARTQASKLQIGGGGTSDPNMLLLNVSGGAGDGYLSLNGDNNSSVKLDIWGSQRVRGDLTLSGSNDGKTTGAISASGNITGKYLQPTSISIAGEVCSPDGLISRDETGAILSCQNGEWKGTGGGSITRTATDSLRFQSTGDFNYLNVSVVSKFYPADGTHTGSATFNVLVGGKTVGQITTSITVWKAGSRGHYWGYENTGATLRMFTTAVKQGDVVQVVMASSGFHSSSDISVSLSQ
ncbi:shufflon system plasmid conjugative transfer pilus tip adhesin PilV [Pectobacterium versatile]|uniref:shufflon system plasmid conjugative transfer pilus tip adhesin PilV n=1 Tax=Pectobacterium versatile TaxID=2488639 RepID=UPI000D6219FB|nr:MULTISPECIES: shufflon system plasmid conjugative transfer pilus tip adhesin PilV [Pectobacterium]MBD0848736.1 pilus assembly protein PilV [Pectobacterium carotovorum subsp. carotovorum]MBK4826721.1 Shufflon protein [Pectobacterium carotovorum subsp. carotovorum]PWD65010.1 shufflon system plasmid conjugative transfer pilus tip adhesin PilV [Pectobacterium versatile]UNE80244.1 shufflon system plasmid conjugative transfer pilus tip adhesin PilV [Pectobacterium versatile]